MQVQVIYFSQFNKKTNIFFRRLAQTYLSSGGRDDFRRGDNITRKYTPMQNILLSNKLPGTNCILLSMIFSNMRLGMMLQHDAYNCSSILSSITDALTHQQVGNQYFLVARPLDVPCFGSKVG